MGFLQDIRFAFRYARKKWLFTLVIVTTLGLCIGANSAVFSIVDAALLRPLPYPEPDRLTLIELRFRSPRGEGTRNSHDGRTWEVLRDGMTMQDLAVFREASTGVNFAFAGHVQLVRQQKAGSGFFRVLGRSPLIGREFTPEEDRPGGPPVALLSHELWTRVWNRDPSALGSSCLLRGEPHTIIGILPPGFATNVPVDVWTPLQPSTSGEGSGTNYQILGRLRDGTSWEQADAEVQAIGRRALTDMGLPPDVEARFGIVDLQQGRTVDLRMPLLLLWGAVGTVLLIGCVNVAGMLLARGAERTRELGTRLALGGGQNAILRQLLTESFLYAMIGGAIGIAIGKLALIAVKADAVDGLPFLAFVDLDARVLVGTLALTVIVCALFGMLPALHGSRLDVRRALAEARAGAGPQHHRHRRVLLVTQVALTVLLLVAATVLLRSLAHLWRLQPGFDPNHLLSVTLSLDDARYASRERVDEFFRDTLARLETIPGVESVAASLGLPYERRLNMPFVFAGEPLDAPHTTTLTYVSAGFFDTLRIPLLRGRTFTDADGPDAPNVVVVNRAFVERYLPDQGVLGARLLMANAAREIVGVVGDVQQRPSFGTRAPVAVLPAVYVPLAQTSDGFLELVHTWFSPSLTVRTAGTPAGVRESVRDVVAKTDPLIPIASFRTIDDVKQSILSFPRLLAYVVAAFAGLGALLTTVGIYGIVAHTVTSRSRELCLRIAIGATVSEAMETAVRPSLGLAGIGLLLGSVLAWLVRPMLQRFVWGVGVTDPITLVGVVLGTILVAFTASLIPASRIARMSPAQRLREE